MKQALHLGIVAALAAIIFYSCDPRLYYLGDTYTATDTLQVYYNLQDVKQPYKVIGRITNQPTAAINMDKLKDQMILKGKQVGANGIVFDELRGKGREGDEREVHAQLIRYTNQ